ARDPVSAAAEASGAATSGGCQARATAAEASGARAGSGETAGLSGRAVTAERRLQIESAAPEGSGAAFRFRRALTLGGVRLDRRSRRQVVLTGRQAIEELQHL